MAFFFHKFFVFWEKIFWKQVTFGKPVFSLTFFDNSTCKGIFTPIIWIIFRKNVFLSNIFTGKWIVTQIVGIPYVKKLFLYLMSKKFWHFPPKKIQTFEYFYHFWLKKCLVVVHFWSKTPSFWKSGYPNIYSSKMIFRRSYLSPLSFKRRFKIFTMQFVPKTGLF